MTAPCIPPYVLLSVIKPRFANAVSTLASAAFPPRLPETVGRTTAAAPRKPILGAVPLASIVVTVLSLVALNLFLKRTTMGQAMRAAAEDFQVLRLMGIKANRVIAVAFGLSGALAGVSAVLWVAQRGSVDPLMGFIPVLKAFVAAVIGGLGSLPGAVVGGFVLGISEVLFQAFLPEAALPFRDAFVLSVVIAILIWRPEGLIPAKTARRS